MYKAEVFILNLYKNKNRKHYNDTYETYTLRLLRWYFEKLGAFMLCKGMWVIWYRNFVLDNSLYFFNGLTGCLHT